MQSSVGKFMATIMVATMSALGLQNTGSKASKMPITAFNHQTGKIPYYRNFYDYLPLKRVKGKWRVRK